MEVEIRPLSKTDIGPIWIINEEGLPGTGKVSHDEIEALLDYASLAVGAYYGEKLVGFVICLPPKTAYGSLNYAWFNQRYSEFLYVDRIAVGAQYQNQKIGTILYDYVKINARENRIPVTAEVNIHPPNPGSMRFHDRNGFQQVGVLDHDEKSVAMFVYQQ
ncbi:MAG: GNAT family N-acetyltransferase [Candidatus Poseidoniaceae archaeon]|jgi:predicted GNAT superfamily acetyltransferase